MTLVTGHSEALPGESYTYYTVDTPGLRADLGRGTIEGTDAERETWAGATERYLTTVQAAEAALLKARQRWRGFLPGGRRRQYRAYQQYRRSMTVAATAYLPARDEINRRLSHHRTEQLHAQRAKAQHAPSGSDSGASGATL
ncbi:hypothetical protein JJV70_09515 [Streptomyces sp. JJ66]|uniref:hypothetical protein n=1 Tax=Streptomyces sp. JJ66 TaxID=2803843 RepID=UPI001C55FD9F|nr:hypothetical protein [Streptomyces sp. JJ66]MBW1602343.1 hypothetical protein [Streptomyces sp. JJ66]